MWDGMGKMVYLSLDLFEVSVGQAGSTVQHPLGNMGLEFTIKTRTKNADLGDIIHSIF